jgi:PAS domain S-box-containing protein
LIQTETRTCALKMKLFRINRLSLNLRLLLLTALTGIVVFLGTDLVIVREVERSFRSQVEERLQQQAIDGRSRFDQFIKAHYQLARIIVSQTSFREYVATLQEGRDALESRPFQPSWLPRSSVLRVLAYAEFYLLFDEAGGLLEFFQSGPLPLPEALRYPDSNVLEASHNENFFALLNGIPFILSAESVAHPVYGKIILLLATPIDDHLLLHLLPASAEKQIIAISTGFDPYVIGSSNQELIPNGRKFADLKEQYFVSGETVFNYEYSDLLITYNQLMPRETVSELASPVINRQRLQLLFITTLFVGIFSFLINSVSRRIQGITRGVVRFSEEALGKPAEELQGKDEIATLSEQFDFLTKEVIAASREQAALLSSVLNAMPAPIYYIDRQGIYLGCNEPFARIIGRDREEIVGKSIFELLPKAQAEKYHKLDEDLFATGGKKVEPMKLEDAIGKGRDVIFHRAVFHKATGEVGGLVGVILDISNIKQAQEDLASANTFLRSLIH